MDEEKKYINYSSRITGNLSSLSYPVIFLQQLKVMSRGVERSVPHAVMFKQVVSNQGSDLQAEKNKKFRTIMILVLRKMACNPNDRFCSVLT